MLNNRDILLQDHVMVLSFAQEEDYNKSMKVLHSDCFDCVLCHMPGHSMAVLGAELQKPEVTKLLTPEYTSSTESCLQFWYDFDFKLISDLLSPICS